MYQKQPHSITLAMTVFLMLTLMLTEKIQAQPSSVDTASVTVTPLVLTGQIGASYGYNSLVAQSALFFHFGGPGLTWKYGDWSLALHISPSLRWQFGDLMRPTMGFGPTLGYKRWLLVAPIYFDAINGKTTYIPTIGFGYRF
jgi:hypothetical protein